MDLVKLPRLSEGVEDWVRCRVARTQQGLNQLSADGRMTCESPAAATRRVPGAMTGESDRSGGHWKFPSTHKKGKH